MTTRKQQPTHPGSILKNLYLEPLDLTITEAAAALGVARKTLSKIVNEQASVTPIMALRLSRAFNTSPELWLNLQRNHDLWQAAHETQVWKDVRQIAV